MKSASGCIYEGEWDNGIKNGNGILTKIDKDVFQVSYEKGIQHASCTLLKKGNGKRVLPPSETDDTQTPSFKRRQIDEYNWGSYIRP